MLLTSSCVNTVGKFILRFDRVGAIPSPKSISRTLLYKNINAFNACFWVAAATFFFSARWLKNRSTSCLPISLGWILQRFTLPFTPAAPMGGISAQLRQRLVGFPFHSNPERSGSPLRFDKLQDIPAKADNLCQGIRKSSTIKHKI